MPIPVQNIYYLLCYAWNKLEERDRVSVTIDDDTELPDLFARVLINACRILLKRGFERDYIPVTEERFGVKGKLEVSRSIKQNSFQTFRAVCSYDDYSADILPNRILFTTLHGLLRTVGLDEELKDQIRMLLRMFPQVNMIKLKPAVFKQVRIHRNNRFYEFILHICQLIYESSLPAEGPGSYRFTDFTRDEKKMATLFERFIYRFYDIEMPELRPRADQIQWDFEAIDDEDMQYVPLMKTDITLHGSDPKIIIDAKYYRDTMRVNFGREKIKSENLYQLFSYLLNQDDGTIRTKYARGILLYPTTRNEFDLNYRYGTHEIQIKRECKSNSV